MLSLLCQLLLVRLVDCIVNLSDFYSYRLIGKLTAFFAASGVQLAQTQRGMFHYHRTVFSSILKIKVDLTLAKTATLRITLNLDGVSITTKSHTHPSITLVNFSSINLVSIFRYSSSSSNPVYARHVGSSSLGFSLSSHRESYIGL